MAETTKRKETVEPQETDGSASGEAARAQTLWIRPSAWEAMCVIKEDIGATWGRLVDIFAERMMTSGLMSEAGMARLREVSKKAALAADCGWGFDFEARDTWPLAAGHAKEMAADMKRMADQLTELVEVIEDHAVTMAELADTDPEPEKEDSL